MAYDLFISYARVDDAKGRISEFVAHLESEIEAFAGRDLEFFFDKQEIHGMEDWQHRILQGLRDSRLLLAFLSPAYFDSPWCEWEFNEYLKSEVASAYFGDGVAPIFFMDVPGLDGEEFLGQRGEWVAELRRRHQFDLRPWQDTGVEALREAEVALRMKSLTEELGGRIKRADRAGHSLGNIPRHNPHFVGRRAELRRLRESLALRRVGVLTTAHGVGGMGKTALAMEYAHAFAHEYGGGRWLVPCTGKSDLRLALSGLHSEPGMAFEYTDEEKLDLDLQFARMLRELKQLAEAREPHACLVILDNVDNPELLAPAQVTRLPAENWLQVLATSRLGEKQLHGLQKDRAFVDVDKLPKDDALDLIRSFQPGGVFRGEDERAAALDIVSLLDGFPLAVEVAAVYLGEAAEEGVTCGGFLERLRREGVRGLDEAAEDTETGLNHAEKGLRSTILPTLALLSPVERCVLDYAALLPPDAVAVPWLRALVAGEYPEMGQEAGPGRRDPWKRVLGRLFGLRLLQLSEVEESGRALRLARMHRLIQDLLRREMADELLAEREESVAGVLRTRANALQEESKWVEARWELKPLEAVAWAWDERGHAEAAVLLLMIGMDYYKVADWAAAEPLFRRALAIWEVSHEQDHPEVAIACNNLAELLRTTNHLSEAESLFRRALAIWEASDGPDHSNVAFACNNLGMLLNSTNRHGEAEPLLRRALAIREASHGPDHTDVAYSCNNLGALLRATNRLGDAEILYRRALAAWEASYGPDHPNVALACNNLATLLYDTNRFDQAESLYRRALAIYEASYGPDHPQVAAVCVGLAALLQSTNRLDEAEPLYRRALAIDEASYGPDHPQVATVCVGLANLLGDINRRGEAEPLLRRALAIYEASYGPSHPKVAMACSELALLFQNTNRFDEAEPLFRRALAIYEASYGPEHPLVATGCVNLASLLHDTYRFDQAESLYCRALAIQEASYGPEHPRVATACNNLAVLFWATQRLGEAEPLLRRTLAIDEASYGPEHPRVATACNNLAALLQATNRFDEAESLFRRALAIWEASYGVDHPNVAIARGNIANLLERRSQGTQQTC